MIKLDPRSDQNLYGRLEFKNKMPYTAEDLHLQEDIVNQKIGALAQSIGGSGILSVPKLSVTVFPTIGKASVETLEPLPANIEGEVFYIYDDHHSLVWDKSTYTGSAWALAWWDIVGVDDYRYGNTCRDNYKEVTPNYNSDLGINTSTMYRVYYGLALSNQQIDYEKLVPQDFSFNLLYKGNSTTLSVASSDLIRIGKSFKIKQISHQLLDGTRTYYLIPLFAINNGNPKLYRNRIHNVNDIEGLADALEAAGKVKSVNGETGNVVIRPVPNGGTTGQVLKKTDGGYAWMVDGIGDPSEAPTVTDKSSVWAGIESVALGQLGGLKFVALSQAEYDGLSTKDPGTLYLVKEG